MKPSYRSEVLPRGGAGPDQPDHPLVRIFSLLAAVVTRIAQSLAAAGLLFCLMAVVYGVIMRYVFNNAPIWVDDTVSFMLVGIVMLAAASTLRSNEHIAVDILTAQLGSKGKKVVRWWALFSVMLFSLILIFNGWDVAMFSEMLGIYTSGNVELPIWYLQLLLPLGGVLMLVVTLELIAREIFPSSTNTSEQSKDAEVAK